jgi:hypothetical protein
MSKRRSVIAAVAAIVLCHFAARSGAAQGLSVQREQGNHRMYRWYVANPVRFQKSLKVEIQDLCNFGPGADDFTSVAYWYQEEPHRPFALQPYAERTASSKAGEGKK